MKILMVCLGNICRSPLAEGILKHKCLKEGLNWHIESAGTYDSSVGKAPHKFSQKVAKLNGIDICEKRSRLFVPEDFERFDKIYAMARDVMDEIEDLAGKKFNRKKTDLFLNELYPNQNRDVPDPWSGPESGFSDVYEMINLTCERIINKYKTPGQTTA